MSGTEPPILVRATCGTRLRKKPGRLEFQRGVLAPRPGGGYAVRTIWAISMTAGQPSVLAVSATMSGAKSETRVAASAGSRFSACRSMICAV